MQVTTCLIVPVSGENALDYYDEANRPHPREGNDSGLHKIY